MKLSWYIYFFVIFYFIYCCCAFLDNFKVFLFFFFNIGQNRINIILNSLNIVLIFDIFQIRLQVTEKLVHIIWLIFNIITKFFNFGLFLWNLYTFITILTTFCGNHTFKKHVIFVIRAKNHFSMIIFSGTFQIFQKISIIFKIHLIAILGPLFAEIVIFIMFRLISRNERAILELAIIFFICLSENRFTRWFFGGFEVKIWSFFLIFGYNVDFLEVD